MIQIQCSSVSVLIIIICSCGQDRSAIVGPTENDILVASISNCYDSMISSFELNLVQVNNCNHYSSNSDSVKLESVVGDKSILVVLITQYSCLDCVHHVFKTLSEELSEDQLQKVICISTAPNYRESYTFSKLYNLKIDFFYSSKYQY